VSSLAAACATDDCERLCERVGNRLGTCLQEWPATWEDLDAASRAGFVDDCKQAWSEERGQLEPRELDDALLQCSEAGDELSTMRQQGTVCDELRALYLD